MEKRKEAEILRKTMPLIESFFRVRLTRLEDAEDLVQETAYQVMRGWGRFEHRAAVSTWVYAICRNVFSAFLRHRERESEGHTGFPPTSDPVDVDGKYAVELIVDTLDPLFQELYDLYYRRVFSIREISELKSKPEGTVKYDLFVLRKKIRDRL